MPENEKIYEIGGKKFKLKETLTARDKYSNAELFKKFQMQDGTLEVTAANRAEINHFLNTILIQLDGEKVEDSFFDDTDEFLELEITGNFFLKRLELRGNTGEYLNGLMKKASAYLAN